MEAITKYGILLSLLFDQRHIVVGIARHQSLIPEWMGGTRSMRVLALCVAACFVTGASAASSSERPDISVPDIPVAAASSTSDAASAERSGPASSDPAAAQPVESNDTLDHGVTSAEGPQRAVLSKSELCGTAAQVAEANKLPARFFTRLIQQESGFKPLVVSSAGAQGIAQFMPRTASSLGLADPFEPIGALAASGKFLAELVRQFGNLGLAAAAYNAGPKRVLDWITRRGKLPLETRNYVRSITGHAAEAWAAGRRRMWQMALPSQTSCPDVRSPAVEAHLQSRIDADAPDSGKAEVPAPAGTRMARAAITERHSLPRPSRFVIGMPVPATIKATERAVLARHRMPRGAIRRADRKRTRLA
jgi:soluble lytic murein transglycosylase-like protein